MSMFNKILLSFLLAILCQAVHPTTGHTQDDRDLFGTASTPNVLLLIDNSSSMRAIITHPDYDPTFTDPRCVVPPANLGISLAAPQLTRVETLCPGQPGVTIDRDQRFDDRTFYQSRYVYWLTMGASPAIRNEVRQLNNGTYATQCVIDWFGGATTFSLYVRTRITAARDVLAEVLCEERSVGNIRIAVATFRSSTRVTATSLPTPSFPSGTTGTVFTNQGGYVVVPMGEITSTNVYRLHSGSTFYGNQFEHLRRMINEEIETHTGNYTPLSETMFALYQFFMSRDPSQTTEGNTVGTRFPPYQFSTAGSDTTDGLDDGPMATGPDVPADPVQGGCQPNYVLILSDGFPTRDNFTVPDNGTYRTIASAALPAAIRGKVEGWEDVAALVPDAADYPGELATCRNTVRAGAERAGSCYRRSGAGLTGQYDILLDDLAAVMATRDLRPDFTGDQVIRTFTIAFSASDTANALLEQTALAGGGSFFMGSRPDQVRDGLRAAFRAFRTGQYSFTTPLVPPISRSSGDSLYRAFFTPSLGAAFWEGHLEHRDFSGGRDDGTLYWDAGTELQNATPNSRDLRVSLATLTTGDPLPQLLPAVVSRGDVFFAPSDYQGFGVPTPNTTGFDNTDQGQIHEAVLHTMRGCVYPTRNTTCPSRASTVPSGTTRNDGATVLGDIFHSRPVVVGAPRGLSSEPSYVSFRASHGTREQRVFVGANDGFLHAFHAGSWDPMQQVYTNGSGVERFGFMPWPVRRAIASFVRNLSTGNPMHRFFVDGSPSASDAWFYNDNLAIRSKLDNGSEWRTVLIGGLRRGGNAYYALDVTDAGAGGSTAKYLWEFPAESTPNARIGQTWARPVIARVKVRHGSATHERWVAILTGGYHRGGDPNRGSDYDVLDEVGRGIYIVDIKTGGLLGAKRQRFVSQTGVSNTDPEVEMAYAIPSTPAVFDIDGDDYVDVIYVGDLGGNVWKWVIGESGNNYLVDAVNDAMADVSQPNTNFRLFFRAQATPSVSLGVSHGADTYYRSFFSPPAGVLRGSTLWLALGSGERAHLQRPAGPDDATATSDNNRFYVLTDPNPFDASQPVALSPLQNGGNTDVGTASTAATEADLVDVSTSTSCTPLGAAQRGYYFIAANGEKFSTDVLVSRFQVAVGSYTPAVGGGCAQSTGEGHLYNFRLACGEGLSSATGPASRSGRRSRAGVGAPNAPRRSVQLPGGSSNIYHNTSSQIELQNEAGPGGYDEGVGQLYWRERRD